MKLYLLILTIFQVFSINAQLSKIRIHDNTFVYKWNYSSQTSNKEIWVIAKVLNQNDTLKMSSNVKLEFNYDTLTSVDYDEHFLDAYLKDISYNFNLSKIDSSNNINELELNSLIFSLLNKGDSVLRLDLNKTKSKLYFDAVGKIIRILENDSLNFLNEYLMYNNLDKYSLEAHYLDASFKNKRRKIYLIARSSFINNYWPTQIQDEIIFNDNPLDWTWYFGGSKKFKSTLKKTLKNKGPIYSNDQKYFIGYR